MAKTLVGPAWKKASEVWVTPVCEDMAAVAERISDFHDQWHRLVVGKPVEYLGGSPPLADIATEIALPGDLLFTGLKRLMQIGGILVGVVSSQPLIVNACLKSLAHDAILKVVSKGIGNFLGNTLEPIGTCQRDIETAKIKDTYVLQMVHDFQPSQETSSPEPNNQVPVITRDAGTSRSLPQGGGAPNTQGQRPGLERTPDAPAARSVEHLTINFGFGEGVKDGGASIQPGKGKKKTIEQELPDPGMDDY